MVSFQSAFSSYIFDQKCVSGATFEYCGISPFLITLVFVQGISSFVLIYFFSKFACNFFNNPTKANRTMTFLTFPGIFYSTVNFILCFYPYYDNIVQSLSLLSSSLRSFTYIVTSNQAIFLIQLIHPKFGMTLNFIMIFIMAITFIYVVVILLGILIRFVPDDIFYCLSNVFEYLSIFLYTYVCTYAFVFLKDIEWIVTPGYCKKMKIILFFNSFLNFFGIVYNAYFHFKDPYKVLYVRFAIKHVPVKKRRNAYLLIMLIKTFILGDLPVLMIVIAMLYMKPIDNAKKDEDNNDIELISDESPKTMLHDNLIE